MSGDGQVIQIVNGTVLTPQGWIKNGVVTICGRRILEVGASNLKTEGTKLIDAAGMYVVPGGIDLHCHGGGGSDFTEGTEEAFKRVITAHLRHGTTSLFPTLASSPVAVMEGAAEVTAKLMADPDSPVLGLHLEGPFLNPQEAGGQLPAHIILPAPEIYVPLIERWPCIKRCDAAPELPGALKFGEYVSGKGILAGIAHTLARYAEVRDARRSGYTHATHFYNGMQGFHPENGYKREGTVESVYLIDDMTVELIADGKHVPPAILQLVHKLKGTERTCLVTDALAPAASRSTHHAYDSRVIIEDGVCKLADRSALAGSIATMDRLIQTVVREADIPLEDAVRMVSETPAKIMGVYDRKGAVQQGKDADILILDKDLQIRAVWQMGRLVERNDETRNLFP